MESVQVSAEKVVTDEKLVQEAKQKVVILITMVMWYVVTVVSVCSAVVTLFSLGPRSDVFLVFGRLSLLVTISTLALRYNRHSIVRIRSMLGICSIIGAFGVYRAWAAGYQSSYNALLMWSVVAVVTLIGTFVIPKIYKPKGVTENGD